MTNLLVETHSYAPLDIPGTERDRDRAGGQAVLPGTRFPVARLIAELAECPNLKEITADLGLDFEDARKAVMGVAHAIETTDAAFRNVRREIWRCTVCREVLPDPVNGTWRCVFKAAGGCGDGAKTVRWEHHCTSEWSHAEQES